MPDHRCWRASERGPKGGSQCTKGDTRFVLDSGERSCFAHLPRPLWNQETCSHSAAPTGKCAYCGAFPVTADASE